MGEVVGVLKVSGKSVILDFWAHGGVPHLVTSSLTPINPYGVLMGEKLVAWKFRETVKEQMKYGRMFQRQIASRETRFRDCFWILGESRVVTRVGSFVILVSVDSGKVGSGVTFLILFCHEYRDWLERETPLRSVSSLWDTWCQERHQGGQGSVSFLSPIVSFKCRPLWDTLWSSTS